MPTEIEAFIFDVDGVISNDTAEYHYRSWQQLADEEGISFSRQDNEQFRGVARQECLRLFLNGRKISKAQEAEWLARKDAYFNEHLASMTPDSRLPGIGEFLADADEHGIRLGIASASRNARNVLEKLDLLDFFTVVGDGTTRVKPKPAPDLFVWVAGYLRAEVEATVVFEDAETGVKAARDAGFWTVGIGDIKTAHIPLSNLHGTQVKDILERLDETN